MANDTTRDVAVTQATMRTDITAPQCRFLFVLRESGGGVQVELGLARRLIGRGHAVHILGDPCLATDAQTTGCIFSSYVRAPYRIERTKVDPDLQGRVFSVRNMTVWFSVSLAYLTAGPLADQVFGPLLTVEGFFAGSVGRLIGVESRRGIGLLFIVMGILTLLVTTAGYLHPRLRLVEQELLDAIADRSPSYAGQHESVSCQPRPDLISE